MYKWNLYLSLNWFRPSKETAPFFVLLQYEKMHVDVNMLMNSPQLGFIVGFPNLLLINIKHNKVLEYKASLEVLILVLQHNRDC